MNIAELLLSKDIPYQGCGGHHFKAINPETGEEVLMCRGSFWDPRQKPEDLNPYMQWKVTMQWVPKENK